MLNKIRIAFTALIMAAPAVAAIDSALVANPGFRGGPAYFDGGGFMFSSP